MYIFIQETTRLRIQICNPGNKESKTSLQIQTKVQCHHYLVLDFKLVQLIPLLVCKLLKWNHTLQKENYQTSLVKFSLF